ncbi:hypothetical protein V1291_005367 [Nitrobacteraceae bacterium AZCC 1564]
MNQPSACALSAPFGEVTGDDRCITRVPWGETVAEPRAFAGHPESEASHALAFDKRIILQVDIDDIDMKPRVGFCRRITKANKQKDARWKSRAFGP